MTNETMVTIQGWIGNVPMMRDVAGTPVLNFRVGATPRRLNRTTNQWVDGETQWYGVSAWRRLAEHAAKSLGQGDPVVIHGRLNHRTYVNKQGVEVLALEIDAVTIGHDLTRGVATFLKAPRAVDGATRPAPEPPPFGPGLAPPSDDPYAGTGDAAAPTGDDAEDGSRTAA